MLWRDLHTAQGSLIDATICMNFKNESLFQHNDIVCHFLVIVIFYCANTTTLHMPDWKFSEGDRWVKLGCKMGHCIKEAENH